MRTPSESTNICCHSGDLKSASPEAYTCNYIAYVSIYLLPYGHFVISSSVQLQKFSTIQRFFLSWSSSQFPMRYTRRDVSTQRLTGNAVVCRAYKFKRPRKNRPRGWMRSKGTPRANAVLLTVDTTRHQPSCAKRIHQVQEHTSLKRGDSGKGRRAKRRWAKADLHDGTKNAGAAGA